MADQRAHRRTPGSQRASLFHAGVGAGQQPFGALYGLHQDILAPGHHTALAAKQAGWLLVLPITGSVQVAPATEACAIMVQVEELLLVAVAAGETVQLHNDYSTETIEFIHVWLAGPAGAAAPARLFAFRFADQPACLTEVVTDHPVAVSIGRLAGRTTVEYALRHAGGRFFGVVLAGAFEVAGRLLHAHDALALWDAPHVELEALSNDAVLLVLELPPVAAGPHS